MEKDGTSFHFEPRFKNALEQALAFFREEEQASTSSVLDIQEAAGDAIDGVLSFRIALFRKSVRKSRPDDVDFDLAEIFPQLLGEKEPARLETDEDEPFIKGLRDRMIQAIPNLLKAMRARASIRAFTKPAMVPEIEVAAHSADVKSIGTPGTITRLRMLMSEEGLEWVAESGGEEGSRVEAAARVRKGAR